MPRQSWWWACVVRWAGGVGQPAALRLRGVVGGRVAAALGRGGGRRRRGGARGGAAQHVRGRRRAAAGGAGGRRGRLPRERAVQPRPAACARAARLPVDRAAALPQLVTTVCEVGVGQVTL